MNCINNKTRFAWQTATDKASQTENHDPLIFANKWPIHSPEFGGLLNTAQILVLDFAAAYHNKSNNNCHNAKEPTII